MDPGVGGPFISLQTISKKVLKQAKVCRRLIAKAVLCLNRKDVLQAAGPIQLCAGQPSGCEAAVHTMRTHQIYAGTILQVDATNAFNCAVSFKKLVELITYCVDSLLYIDGDYILSQEGTTQRDSLAMPMHALGLCS